MTRIDIIGANDFHIQHLKSAYRELPRVFSYVVKYGVNKNRIPPHYTLNKGHVLFFTDKLKFVFKQYSDVYTELCKLGYNLTYTPQDLYNKYKHIIGAKEQIEWTPRQQDIELNKERIQQRIKEFKK